MTEQIASRPEPSYTAGYEFDSSVKHGWLDAVFQVPKYRVHYDKAVKSNRNLRFLWYWEIPITELDKYTEIQLFGGPDTPASQDVERFPAFDHPGIIRVFAQWSDKGKLYVVTDWFDDSLLDRAAKATVKDLARWICEAAAALDYMGSRQLFPPPVSAGSINTTARVDGVIGYGHGEDQL